MDNCITFGGSMTAQINFAMQQNYVPVFRDITMKNTTSEPISDVSLCISFEPGFAREFSSPALTLPPGQPVSVSPVNIVIDPGYLFSLTEKIVGSVTINAVRNGQVIASEVRSIELLPYDQWTGVNLMPEMTAAFIMPNHPCIQDIISRASEFLKKWTGDPAFTGYQSRSANMVKQQMGAIYAALQTLNIAYTMPPASFETAQRVRTPDAVVEGKSGTCIDLAVLYCSALESVGLNSLLVIVEGHAFAGCWLSNETFPDCLQFDVSALTKRAASGIDAMAFINCVDFTAGKKCDFSDSEKNAADYLADPEKFLFAIDVERTRASGVRPMPARISENGTFRAADYGERKRSEITSAPGELDIIGDLSANGQPREVTKQMIWERKLLDLSLRNSLLNFRPGTMNVQIMMTDLGKLEDEISKGDEFRIMPVPSDMMLTAADSKIFETENQTDQITAITDAEFKSHRLRTFLNESDLEKIMKKLHRQAKVSIEENGANTIYLALGFLRWFETDKSEKARYAPLVLVPVEITRKVQEKAFSISVRDEETQVNITALEMLRQFFGIDIQGLDPIPADENGVDLRLIFSTIRQAIMARSRWDIVECAFIGQFSFNRFIMWNDIRNRADELAQNKVVASLISGETQWTSDSLNASPLELDTNIDPADLAVPVAADSSQLAAVWAANSGNSFVLHGPPGTGKSQTITNMIANALHHGKTVLFVAEKMAALEVVQKRLAKIGLDPFCLELHSNKAQKRSVLRQLEQTLSIGKVKEPAQFKAQAEKIRELRSQLNDTMAEIHKVRNCGLSLYDAAVRFEQNRSEGGKFSFTQSQIDAMTPTSYQTWREELEKLTAAARDFGDVSGSPLKICRLTECTPGTRDELRSALEDLKFAVSDAQSQKKALCAMTGAEDLSFEKCAAAADILAAASGEGWIIPDALSAPDWEISGAKAAQLLDTGRQLSAAKSEVLANYESSVLSYDCGKALADWKTVQSGGFFGKLFKSGKIVKALAAHAKSPGTVTKESFAQQCQKIIQMKDLENAVSSANPTVTGSLGALWQGADTNWDTLADAMSLSASLREKIAGSPLSAQEKSAMAKALSSGYASPSQRNANRQNTDNITASVNRVNESLDALREKFAFDTNDLISGENWSDNAIATADRISASLTSLKEWTGIVTIVKNLEKMGLGSVAQNFLDGKVPTEKLVSSFDCDLCRCVVTSVISSVPVLAKFQGTLFDETIRKYNETLEDFSRLTINELVAELSAKVPAPGTSAASSEIGILQKAIKSGGRMMSIRKLFDSIPNLLRRMCPVMLMSPISVAQYIDPAYPKFDLVIFDEASQLPTCEAVGAIARGENVIIVGDPKQLPPTSFFASNQTDEENFEKEDLESVLDDCLALSMPQQHLLWHYRSRHESLIAYSNAKYYDNKLYTFPSPDDQVSEVSWVKVEGFYDKSSSRTNKAEAQAIVAEISRRLEDPALRKLSIGVVTFSQPQQNLIDDMLLDAYRERPELEQWANEQYEPILIKNLENVQGDERDVIMFSIGYGPDKEGKVSMNFGPLNRDGGWRRLNVAISRSKCQMIVFSVITPDMIDLSRTRSEGVEGLKGFLEFAAKGRSALAVRGNSSAEGKGFETILAKELRKRGYTVNCSVGCSDYKIDCAVADPEQPERYLLGINCLTKSSYTGSTAKDRHISQSGVLRGLGWNTMAVYLLDWLDNREKVLGKIEEEIASTLKRKHEPEKTADSSNKPAAPLEFETEEVHSLADQCAQYPEFDVKPYGSPDDLAANAGKCVGDILETLAPVSRNALTKKVLACFGISRISANTKKAVDDALANCGAVVTTAGENEFIWKAGQSPESYDTCRTVYSGEKRSLDDIAPEEIAAGIKLIMAAQVAMLRDDLIRETAHLFGASRVTPSIETAVSLGIRAAKSRGFVKFTEDGRITYTE